MSRDTRFDQSGLPNIPGFRVSVDTRKRFHKTHLFDVRNGIPVTDLSRNPSAITPSELENKIISKTQTDTETNRNAKKGQSSSVITDSSKLPRWVVFDRKVLRFYSYFTENVFNSAIESTRVRKCVIYYFLEDDTVMIDEVRTENSGIPQSTFLKRQRVPKGKGQWLHYLDILVGQSVVIYNRNFNIIDADESTRKYLLVNNNIELCSATEYPKDDYILNQEKREEYCKLSASSGNDVKSYVEAILGRVSSQRLAASKKYLANDGKVLRFNGVWRDNSWGGSTRKYTILYFLADDTIQVLEEFSKNCGYDPYPALLSRAPLPKKYIPSGCTIGIKHDVHAPQNDYYNHLDLRIGGYLNVYGRQVLLTNCDEFTKKFYISVHHFKEEDFAEIEIEDHDAAKEKPVREIPPYNGFGTEEDSLGSWKSLVPKPPVKDVAKLIKYDGCCLRFLAALNPSKTQIENVQRRFVIEFFLTDDTVKVYERSVRNSGFLGGKFLERRKLKNPQHNKWFHAEDFYVGATININGFSFDLLETDAQTVGIMNNNIEVFTRDSPEQILKGLADKLWDKSFNQTKTFRSVDTDKDRYISPSEMKALCKKYGWNVNPNQLKVIFNYFDTDASGQISVDEFFKALHKYKLASHIYPIDRKVNN